jgi:hypothetical protein
VSAGLESQTNQAVATLSQELDAELAFISSEEYSEFLKKTIPKVNDARYQRYQNLVGKSDAEYNQAKDVNL